MTSVVEEPPSRDSSTPQAGIPVKTDNEFYRKLLHMLPGLLPFGLAFLPHDDPPDWIAMGLVVGISVILTAVYLALHPRVSRPEEANFLSTALSYPATVLGTLLVFPAHAEFAMVVVILIAFGDGFAYHLREKLRPTPFALEPRKNLGRHSGVCGVFGPGGHAGVLAGSKKSRSFAAVGGSLLRIDGLGLRRPPSPGRPGSPTISASA